MWLIVNSGLIGSYENNISKLKKQYLRYLCLKRTLIVLVLIKHIYFAVAQFDEKLETSNLPPIPQYLLYKEILLSADILFNECRNSYLSSFTAINSQQLILFVI